MWSAGDILNDKYRLVESLGTGGMGEVFLAEHKFLEKPVAIKVLHSDIADDADALTRFYREAQAAAALRHPGIVEVYDVGWEEDGAPYIVMEYLEGGHLESVLQREGGRLEPEYASEIASQILSVLAAVHEKGIIHRDIKPENVVVCDSADPDDDTPVVKLLDFGVALMLGDVSTRLTRVGEILGSVPYMSPEQARGEDEIDHRIDIWGVGAILYRMLVGNPPFPAKKPHQVLVRIMREPLIRAASLMPDLPEELDLILSKALEKDVAERYQSAAEFRSDLLAYLDLAQRQRRKALSKTPGEKAVDEDTTLTNLMRLKAAKEAADAARKARGEGEKGDRPRHTPPPEAPKVHCLRVVRGLDAGNLIRLVDTDFVIGRIDECDIVLSDENVSRRHARIQRRGDSVVIEDLGSKNGIFVNGTPTIRAVLRSGDQILLGGVTLLKYVMLDKQDVEHHEQVFESISLDVLTGALNRRSTESQLAAEWSYARRHGHSLSVLLMDVDAFRNINERFGDEVGDQVLRELARICRGAIRGEDLLGRYGGEEFVVVSPGIGHKGAMKLARRLRRLISKQRFGVGSDEVRITVSVGVATFAGSRERWPQDLIKVASDRLALAKKAGGNKEVGA